MGGIPHDKYEPKKGFETWLDKRLPIGRLVYDTLMIPTPKNLNWMWIWGIILTFCLVLQIITGIILVMHYTPHVDHAFDSVEHESIWTALANQGVHLGYVRSLSNLYKGQTGRVKTDRTNSPGLVPRAC